MRITELVSHNQLIKDKGYVCIYTFITIISFPTKTNIVFQDALQNGIKGGKKVIWPYRGDDEFSS